MPAIRDTAFEMIQLVLPGHANTRGTLYGGAMMNWITVAAAMAAMRLPRGSVTTVRIGDEGPQPVPPFTPRPEAERRRWAAAAERRARWQARQARLRSPAP